MAPPEPHGEVASVGAARLMLEGFAASAITGVFAARMFPAEASLVSICLAALLTGDSVGLLSRTRSGNPFVLLSTRIVALFLGCVGGYLALALLLPEADAAAAFARQLAYMPERSLAGGFGDFQGILASNLYVLLFFLVVAFGFRKGGLMIAVGWNASVWGAVFGTLARRGDGLGALALATGPHLVAEAAAYVLAGLAGVLLGRGTLRATLRGTDATGPLLRGAAGLLFGAFGLLLAGAVWEAFAAAAVLAALS